MLPYVAVCCSEYVQWLIHVCDMTRLYIPSYVLQCVAACRSVLQCVAVCTSRWLIHVCDMARSYIWSYVLQCVAVCCSVLQSVAACCSVLHCVRPDDLFMSVIWHVYIHHHMWYVCCVLQSAASVLQCVRPDDLFMSVTWHDYLYHHMWNVLHVIRVLCVAVCCSVLQCVAVCYMTCLYTSSHVIRITCPRA